MRSKTEILEKARSLLEGAKDDFVQKRMCRHFRNCQHNDTLIARTVGKIHYCRLHSHVGEETKIEKLFICDTDEWASECKDFSCRNTQESAEKEFVEIIANPSRCGQLFPRLSALLWVLNDGKHREISLPGDCQDSPPHGHEKNEKEEKSEPGAFWGLIRRVRGGG